MYCYYSLNGQRQIIVTSVLTLLTQLRVKLWCFDLVSFKIFEAISGTKLLINTSALSTSLFSICLFLFLSLLYSVLLQSFEIKYHKSSLNFFTIKPQNMVWWTKTSNVTSIYQVPDCRVMPKINYRNSFCVTKAGIIPKLEMQLRQPTPLPQWVTSLKIY